MANFDSLGAGYNIADRALTFFEHIFLYIFCRILLRFGVENYRRGNVTPILVTD